MENFMALAEQIVVFRIRSAWHEMARLYNDMAAQYGGTLSNAFILLTINEKEGTPVTKIAPKMGMKPNSLSRILKSMEDQQLIYRKKDQKDKRQVFICLTDLGRDMRRVALEAVFELNDKLVKGLSKEQIAAFYDVMDQVPLAVDLMKQELDEKKAAKAKKALDQD
ncbi:MAG: MarR family transcriptional regulator [Bacteroidota bacterium]